MRFRKLRQRKQRPRTPAQWHDSPATVDRVVPEVGCVVAMSASDVDAGAFTNVLVGGVIVVAAAVVNTGPAVQA